MISLASRGLKISAAVNPVTSSRRRLRMVSALRLASRYWPSLTRSTISETGMLSTTSSRNFLVFSSSRDSDWRSVTSSNSAIRNSGSFCLVARDHAVGARGRASRAALDHEFVAVMALRRVAARRWSAASMVAGGVGLEDLVGALADDVIAGEPREALERAVGEDVAAVLDVLGGDADRHVVEHRFQELLGRGQLRDSLRCSRAILMRCRSTRHSAGGRSSTRIDRPSGSSVTQPSGRRASLANSSTVDTEQAARARRSSSSSRPVMRAGNVGAAEPVDFEIAIVAEDDAVLRIGHHHALVEIVQRRADEGVAPQLRALGRRATPTVSRSRSRPGRKQTTIAADQELPDEIGIEFADIARRGKARGRRGGPRKSARRSHGEQADEGLRRNRILPSCLPVLVSHHSPADLRAECLA